MARFYYPRRQLQDDWVWVTLELPAVPKSWRVRRKPDASPPQSPQLIPQIVTGWLEYLIYLRETNKDPLRVLNPPDYAFWGPNARPTESYADVAWDIALEDGDTPHGLGVRITQVRRTGCRTWMHPQFMPPRVADWLEIGTPRDHTGAWCLDSNWPSIADVEEVVEGNSAVLKIIKTPKSLILRVRGNCGYVADIPSFSHHRTIDGLLTALQILAPIHELLVQAQSAANRGPSPGPLTGKRRRLKRGRIQTNQPPADAGST